MTTRFIVLILLYLGLFAEISCGAGSCPGDLARSASGGGQDQRLAAAEAGGLCLAPGPVETRHDGEGPQKAPQSSGDHCPFCHGTVLPMDGDLAFCVVVPRIRTVRRRPGCDPVPDAPCLLSEKPPRL